MDPYKIKKQNFNKDVIINKISDIYNVLKVYNTDTEWGVLDGFSGIIFFLAAYYKFIQDDKVLAVLYEKIEILNSHIQDVKSPSLCGGYSGICWLYRYLEKEQLIESEDINDSLDELERYTCLCFSKYFKNDFDFLHGGLGIAMYFSMVDSKYSRFVTDSFLQQLDANKIIKQNNQCAWETKALINGKWNNVINFSLAHGMASIFYFLSNLFDKTHNLLAKKLLQQLFNYYKENVNKAEQISMYPSWIAPIQENSFFDSRVAWCYGDLGIAEAIYCAGAMLKDEEMVNYSYKVAQKTIGRISNSMIKDEIFCHGSAGVSFMYNQFYNRTKNMDFRNASLYWLNFTMGKSGKSNCNAGFPLEEKDYNAVSVLNGLSGIGLSLLYIISNTIDNWSKILILS